MPGNGIVNLLKFGESFIAAPPAEQSAGFRRPLRAFGRLYANPEPSRGF